MNATTTTRSIVMTPSRFALEAERTQTADYLLEVILKLDMPQMTREHLRGTIADIRAGNHADDSDQRRAVEAGWNEYWHVQGDGK